MSFVRNAYLEYLPKKIEIPSYQTTKNIQPLIYEVYAAIREDILKKTKEASLYKYYVFDTDVNLYIAGCNNHSFLFFYTNFLIYLFNKIKPMNRRLELVLIGYKKPKVLPLEPNKTLTPINVNSGVTISLNGNGKVIVYRREEMIKVLTHELIHFFDLDHKDPDTYIEQKLQEKFKFLDGFDCRSININESYVDSLACYINAVMYTVLQKPKNFKNALKKTLMKETRFIASQASNVLKYVDYDVGVCEKTHVTSYYVIKALVYLNLAGFMKYISEHNYTLDNLEEYVTVFSLVDLEYLKNTIKKTKSMRMSSLDIMKTI